MTQVKRKSRLARMALPTLGGVMQEQVTTGFWCVAPEERMLLCLLRIRKSSVMTWLPWPGAVAPG